MVPLRPTKTRPEPKAGDILGFSGDCWLSVGINLASYGIPFLIPYADNSDTFSNIWKLRAIRLFRG
jgi:hypothetical protein